MIEIKDVKKTYGSFELEVSMDILDGRITGIVGRNGAGKSTTIKSILGLVKPESGTVLINGVEIGQLPKDKKADFGVALSEAGFSPYFTLTDIVKILRKTFANFEEDFFIEECQKQGLPMNKIIKDFSTGMRAKVKVLIALSHNANILILDEPTAGLDVTARNEVMDLLRSYMEKHEDASMLISSHISTDLEGLCDDIYMIHDGKVILHEDTDAILGQYAVLKVSKVAYEQLDKAYIIKERKEEFGYSCLTNQKQFYLENYPEIVIENGGIDDLIVMMTKS